MKRLMIDMDEVIVIGGFLYIINDFMGTNYTYQDFTDYYMQDAIPVEFKEDYLDYFFYHNMYDHCEIIPYCYEVMEELIKIYKICIGTSYEILGRERESGIIAKYKHEFLLDNFPFLTIKNIDLVNDKDFINCEISIDDKLSNAIGTEQKILFTAYHNLGIDSAELERLDVKRADDWLDIKRLLLK